MTLTVMVVHQVAMIPANIISRQAIATINLHKTDIAELIISEQIIPLPQIAIIIKVITDRVTIIKAITDKAIINRVIISKDTITKTTKKHM